MTKEESKSCIGTIEMLQRLAYNIHGVMDAIDADNCKKIIKALEQEPCEDATLKDIFCMGCEYKEQEPCEDAISRKEVKDIIRKIYVEEFTYVSDKDIETLLREIDKLPSVTLIRPKVEWKYDKTIQNWRCSKCNETPKTLGYVGTKEFMTEHFKFCNHCGADMTGETE